ncbi:unnamed protein product [Urochloa decumbens]|uniref:C2H2-type domain-containing protein n=1 Tax=Urochloa decumbens TaxID=240449 RepID=A0ABC9E8A0_9POAL
MSKGSLLCSLVLLQVCIVQLSLISSSQLTGSPIRGSLLCQQQEDPIRRAQLMSSHGRDEFDGHSADLIFDEERADNEGVDIEAGTEEVQGLLPPDGDDDVDSSGSAGDVECPECGKIFKKDKSMFGHLRSHPNRGYKGATPPLKKLNLSPEIAASLCSSSPGTDQPSGHHHSGLDPRLTPLEILCAYGMLTLKYKYRGNNQATQVPPPPPSFGKLYAVGHAEGGIRGLATDNAAAELKFKGHNAGAQTGNLGIRDGHNGPFVKIPKKRRNMPKEVREVQRKKPKFVLTPKEKRPYVCKHCKAEFSTHQALGGHMAGHHREKKAPTLNGSSFRAHQVMAAESKNGKQLVRSGSEDDDRWHDNVLSLQRGPPPEQFSMSLDAPWHCGQASGGQMRQHHGRTENYCLSPVVMVPTPTPNDSGDRHMLFNIDLNVEAQEQE